MTLLTNLLILPVQSYVMLVGGVALLLGLVVRPLGQIVGWVAWVFLTYTIEMVRLTARVPYASVAVGMAGAATRLGQSLGARAGTSPAPTGDRRRLAGVGGLRLVQPAGWQAACLSRSARKALDGGPSDTALLSQLGRRMPFWDRSIDSVVLTHPDSDHINGLVPVLERYRVATVVHRRIEMESDTYDYWLQLVGQEGAAVYVGITGLSLMLDEGLEMLVLHPGVDV